MKLDVHDIIMHINTKTSTAVTQLSPVEVDVHMVDMEQQNLNGYV